MIPGHGDEDLDGADGVLDPTDEVTHLVAVTHVAPLGAAPARRPPVLLAAASTSATSRAATTTRWPRVKQLARR